MCERYMCASQMTLVVKTLPAREGDAKGTSLIPESGREEWNGRPTPVSLPGKFHGERSLVGYSPQGLKELDTTGWLALTQEVVAVSFSQFDDFIIKTLCYKKEI